MVNIVNLYLWGKNMYSTHFEIFYYLKKMQKKRLHQIDLWIVKLLNLIKNGIQRNFDIHSRSAKMNIIWVTAVASSWICSVSASYTWEMMQIHEFATAITWNISDLNGRPWRSKLLRSLSISEIRKFDDSQINFLEKNFLLFFKLKISKNRCNFFSPTNTNLQSYHRIKQKISYQRASL